MVIEAINCPKTVSRKDNSILINWENVYKSENKNVLYILQMCDEFKEWKTVYWGGKIHFNVTKLAPSTIYDFRLKIKWENNESNWLPFKSATDTDQFFVRHLSRAVKFGRMPLIRKIILKRPILLEAENKENKTPLIQAIESGNLPLLIFLINLGASINTQNMYTKRTPLMTALYYGHLEAASFLIAKEANIKLRDVNGLTGLHHAVDSNNLESVKFAVENGFEIEAKDNSGWTPLLRAVVTEASDDIIKLLIDNGANYKVKDNVGFDVVNHLNLTNRPDLLPLMK